jgi:hypothetical protein
MPADSAQFPRSRPGTSIAASVGMARLRWLAAVALTVAIVTTDSPTCERKSSVSCCPGTTVTPVMTCCGLSATPLTAVGEAPNAARPMATVAAAVTPPAHRSLEDGRGHLPGRLPPTRSVAPVVLRI